MSPDADLHVDLAVVGAGPGGLEAARTAARHGIEVAVLDAAARPGGQYHRQAAAALDPDAPGALHHGWREATRRFDEVLASPYVRHVPSTHVWSAAAPPGGRVVLETVGAHRGRVLARTVVLATGAVERVLPFPGWTLPGVVTVGAAQALLKSQGIAVGRRVVVAGAGPLLLPVAAALVRTGTQVLEVAELGGPATWRAGGTALLRPGKALEAAGYLGALARARVPIRPRTAVVRATGKDALNEVTLARVDGQGRALAGSERQLEVDALCVSHGFAPAIELAVALGCDLTEEVVPAVVVDALQTTSDRRVLGVGELTGVAGADAAVARRLGAAIDPRSLWDAARRRDAARAFGVALRRATEPGPGWIDAMDEDTLVCRCEEVPYRRVRAALDAGVGDPRSVKLTTRCGMGYCQGRLCAPVVGALLHHAIGVVPPEPGALSARPVATPVPLGDL